MPKSDAMTDTSCASSAPDNRALSAAAARERMLAEVTPIVGHEFVPVRSALGRILAADIIAPHDVPAHDNSAMDGYAIHFDSLSGTGETRLNVVGTAFAGNAFSGLVGKGQAVRIMTGAVLPAGADTIVVQEVVRVEEAAVFDAGRATPRPEYPACRRRSGAWPGCVAGRQAYRPGGTGLDCLARDCRS
jgi:molybdopterin biosynthesis enzyme